MYHIRRLARVGVLKKIVWLAIAVKVDHATFGLKGAAFGWKAIAPTILEAKVVRAPLGVNLRILPLTQTVDKHIVRAANSQTIWNY